MANKTPNYNLTKPLASEFYDVEVQNENMDKIDTQMKANADAIKDLQDGQSGKADLVDGKVPADQLPEVDNCKVVFGYYINANFYENSNGTGIITPDTACLYVDRLKNNAYSWDGKMYDALTSQPLTGSTDPTQTTGAEAGQHYINTSTERVFICLGSSGGNYKWQAVSTNALLDTDGKIATQYMPDMDYIPTSQKGAAGGVASLDSSGKVPSAQLPDMEFDPTEAINAHNADTSAHEDIRAALADIDLSGYLPKSGGTMTGQLVAQNNTAYTTKQVRNVFLVAEGNSIPTGANGDLCFVYST